MNREESIKNEKKNCLTVDADSVHVLHRHQCNIGTKSPVCLQGLWR